MKKTSLIKENAKLQELLNPINEEYYGNLLIYVRSNSVFKDEKIWKNSIEFVAECIDGVGNSNTGYGFTGSRRTRFESTGGGD